MKRLGRLGSIGAPMFAVLALAVGVSVTPGRAGAAIQYLGDGGIPNGATGGWDLPAQGSCVGQPSVTTRPKCLGLRFNYSTSTTCTAGSLRAWATSGVCNDLVNNTVGTCVSSCTLPGHSTEAACEEAGGLWIGRLWNADVSVCAITMEDDDRNTVVCARSKGNWITSGACVGSWVMPGASAYNPPLLNTTAAAAGPGDQCLRCHNSITHYNSTRVRDVEDVLYMGHKNMARKVVAGQKWGGPPLHCTNPLYLNEEDCENGGGQWYPEAAYPSDESGNAFNWITGEITVNGTPASLYWIYADWLSPLPRAIYQAGSSPTTHKPLMSYSCARCHTTGWTSDATVKTNKEPEVSFPGVTWDGTTPDTFGKVNLAGGVSGDTNKFASWDQFGIVCSRCHGSAVNNTGGPLPYSAPTGMSTHHSNLTATEYSSWTVSGTTYYGVCTDSRFIPVSGQLPAVSKANCENAGGTNVEPSPGSGFGVWLTPCSDDNYADQTSCQNNGGTWTLPAGSCTVAGSCNNIAGGPYTDQTSCLAAPTANCPGNVTCQWGAATSLYACMDAGGHWTGNLPTRGQTITSLCMQCHRQETSGMPYADTGSGVGSGSGSHPGTYVKVGAYHSTVTYPSHPHGNMFLNSPHGKFSGSFNQIATATFGNGYSSFFQFDGEASGAGNGCTGCHNPHRSTVEVAGIEEALKPCQECHEGQYGVDLTKINHLATAGTPLDPNTVGSEEAAPCITCHMPKGAHMFRINTDANYSTFPMPAAMTSITNANTAADGTFTNAVWVDLDAACGQCHGGGTAQAVTTLSAPTSTSSANLTVTSTDGFTVGQRITVEDAGSFEYDGESIEHGNFESYVVSVTAPNTITVVGAPPISVAAGKVVTQNATANGALYRTKAALAKVAKGMHSNSQTAANVTFSIAANGLGVSVDADANCGSSPCPTFKYDWDWGDGTAHGTTDPANHTYAAAGNKTITLTLTLDSTNENNTVVESVSRTVKLTAPTSAPIASANCTWDGPSWTMSVTDTSTDPDGTPVAALQTVIIDWGDGSSKSFISPSAAANHTYVLPGTYSVTVKAIDKTLKVSTPYSCTTQATPAYFTISGTVFKSNGTTPVASVPVAVKKAGVAIKTVYTATNGTFSAGSLKPGDYTLTPAKTGYVFPSSGVIHVGPSSSGNNINATTP